MISYSTSIESVTPDQLSGPFFVGWPNPPDPATHLRILQGSDHVVLAIHEPDEQIVGFITAITDGVLTAHIPLLEVVEEHRGRGIGSELVQRLLGVLEGFYAVDAVIDVELQPFYGHLGMSPANAVALRRYRHQAGRVDG